MSGLSRDLLNPTIAKILSVFRLDKIYTRGTGSCLVDETGNSYLDFISQYGAVPFGYNPEFLWEALEGVRQSAMPSLVQPSLPREALRLASSLACISPGRLCYSTFCQSGAEAVETAIKLARSATGKPVIVSTCNSFHGKTLGALSATGKSSYQEPFFAPAPDFVSIPYNDLDALEDLLKEQGDDIAAFIVEPIQGEGGIIIAAPGYLQGALELCHRYGALLIIDEIQTGLGRTGRLFACHFEKVDPDIMVLAKALGGGLLPLGVCLSTPEVWNDDFGHLHSSTFANNNLTCAVGCAVIDRLLADDGLVVKQVKEKGDYLLERLYGLARRYPGAVKEVRGRGLIIGLEFNSMADCDSYDLAYLSDAGGFTALVCGFLLNVHKVRLAPFLNDSMTLRLEPSLTITYEEIDHLVEALEDLCIILEYRDYSHLYRFLLGDYRPPHDFVDFRSRTRPVRPSRHVRGDRIDARYAFIIHYPGPEDMVASNPSFERFSRDELYRLMEWESSLPEPGICCHLPALRSQTGKLVEGWLIGVPYGGRQIMNSPRGEVIDSIIQAVEMAKRLGAQVVGLGALTSVVTRGGRDVQGRGIAVTSGNSLTTVMALEALYEGARRMGIDLNRARAAVVGATGSIGRACSLLLSEEVCQITLLGNPRARLSSQRRIEQLIEDILSRANRKRKTGEQRGMSAWLHQVHAWLMGNRTEWSWTMAEKLDKEETITYDDMNSICRVLDLEPPLLMALEIDEVLNACDLIVSASNSADYIIFPDHLKPGAVVCDVARPADVAPEVLARRDDVLILEGGLVQLPDQVAFGQNLGYRDGVALACLSETIMLAMEEDWRDHSIGARLPLEAMEYVRELANRHGFSLSGLKMGGREILDREIETIRNKACLTCSAPAPTQLMSAAHRAVVQLTAASDSFKL